MTKYQKKYRYRLFAERSHSLWHSKALVISCREFLKKLRGKGKLNEKDIKDAMREIKLALLEAECKLQGC